MGTVHVHQKVGIRQKKPKTKISENLPCGRFSACEGAKIMYRDHTKEVQIGNVTIGGGNPIRIQSMTNTKTEDVEATVAQILALEKAGCEIIRCAVPNMDAAKAIGEIKKQIHIPLVADIHFDYKLAIAAIENGQIRFVLIRVILEMNRESVLLLKKQKSTVFQFVLV